MAISTAILIKPHGTGLITAYCHSEIPFLINISWYPMCSFGSVLFSLPFCVVKLLISNGSEHLQKHDPRRNFYINIHAINATSGLSKSYHPIIVSRIPYCDERPISEIAVRFEHHAFPVHWPRDIVFDLSKTSGNISGYLVPCKRPHIMKSLFNLTVFEQ